MKAMATALLVLVACQPNGPKAPKPHAPPPAPACPADSVRAGADVPFRLLPVPPACAHQEVGGLAAPNGVDIVNGAADFKARFQCDGWTPVGPAERVAALRFMRVGGVESAALSAVKDDGKALHLVFTVTRICQGALYAPSEELVLAAIPAGPKPVVLDVCFQPRELQCGMVP